MKLMEFLDTDIEVATAITGSYDPILVTLSFCIVCLAIYSALSIGERAQGLTRTHVRKIWLAWGATVLGAGIWAMHLIGMHAFKLPVAVHYDLSLTLLSVIPAIVSGGIVLCVACQARMSRLRLILGGALVGVGNGLVHYTGMASMLAGARMAYDPPLFIVSIIVAVALSIVALYFHHRINHPGDTRVYWSKFASTVVLGLAVTTMHYTAMASTYFFPVTGIPTTAVAVDHALLHTSVSVVTVLIILLAFATTIIDSRLNAMAGMKNEIAERHRQTEIVRVKNQIMDNILNGIHDYYFAVERDWRICYANNRARELLKGNSNDILGEVLWDTAPEFASFSYKNLARAMANREEVTFETYFPPENRWFNLRAIPSGDGIAVYLHDITENKQLIDSLSQSERRFQDFAEVAADWFWEMDENLRFSGISGGMRQNIGIDRHHIIGKTRWELTSEDTNSSKWIQHKEDLKARRPFHNFKYKFQKPDGTVYYRSISGKPVYNADGRFMGYRGTGTDITGEIVAQRARDESEQRFKDFAETAADWFWEMDEHLRFNYFSDRILEISGVDPKDLLGKTRRDLAHEDVHSKKWQAHFADLDAHRPFRNFSYRTKRPNGTIAYWSISGTPVFHVDGRFKGYHGTGRDVTPEIQAQQALQDSEERFKDFADCAADWFWEMDENLRFNYFSGRMHQITGIDPVNFIGKTRRDLAHENTNDSKWQAHLADLEAHRSFHDFRYKARSADGAIQYRTNSGKPIFDSDGKFKGYRGSSADITAEIQAQEALYQSEERFKDFAEVAADWFWEMDEHLRFNYFSGRMHQITGVDPNTLLRKTRRELARENTNDSKWQAHLSDLEAHRPFHDFRYKTQRADGAILNWSTSGKPIYDADGKFTGYRGVSADVTAEFQAKEALQDSEERFKDFAETAADWFWEMDEHLRFSRLEGNFSETMGVPKEYVLGKTRQELYSGQINDPKWVRHFEDMESRRPFTDFEIKWTSPREKTEKIFLINGKPFYDSDGSFRGYRGVGRDITAAHALSTQLTYQASHDTLTGLVNRRELERRLQRALESTKKDSAVHALCYLDLDQFKVVNDTCGHVAGDELLRQLAKVLPKCVRHQDTVARLGGDEFGVLLEHCSKEQALRVAEAMRRMVADFIFIWQDKTFNVGVSIGLVSITQATDNFNTLLSAADNACYAAKDLGRNRIHVYDETEAGMVRRHGDMQWVTRIHEAIEENRFELAFQPIVSVESFSPGQDNGWDHFELLLRMRDKSGKLIAPGAFLPAAERYNLISKLDRWVISTAFHWLARHPTHLKRVDHCSINLSGQSFGNKEFLNFVLGIFKNGGMPPEKICFEITETSAISDLAGAIDFIKALREIGCLFSLDDFGSGLSSFGYLKSLPVDFIKIDGLFVKDIVEDPISYSMVKSINDIGHVMGKKTIAEFVENEAVLSKLREIGVDYAQGYGICKPQPLDELQVAPVRKNLRVIQAR
ncbi:MAG TPA: PAS domain S-box protein [Sulfuricaulis sp.]|nr:PAS domain S-box protein [Sulfuricaulis sp.]